MQTYKVYEEMTLVDISNPETLVSVTSLANGVIALSDDKVFYTPQELFQFYQPADAMFAPPIKEVQMQVDGVKLIDEEAKQDTYIVTDVNSTEFAKSKQEQQEQHEQVVVVNGDDVMSTRTMTMQMPNVNQQPFSFIDAFEKKHASPIENADMFAAFSALNSINANETAVLSASLQNVMPVASTIQFAKLYNANNDDITACVKHIIKQSITNNIDNLTNDLTAQYMSKIYEQPSCAEEYATDEAKPGRTNY